MSNSFGAIETGQDGSFQEDAIAEEAAKVAAAKEALVDERTEGSELIMGKYGSQDELIAAFKSLQGEYSRLKGAAAEPEAEAPSESEEAPAPEPEQQEQPTVSQEETRKVYEAVYEQAGGEQRYQAMAAWAAKSMTPEAIAAFNEAMTSGDVGRTLSAVKALQYDYMMQTGYEPKLLGGRAPAAEGPKGYTSEAQVVAAMSDPRYQQGSQQDPAYVKEVEARLAASNVFAK